MKPISFTFEGIDYEAPESFYEASMCLLPDGRVLRADGFLESMPPRPTGLEVIEVPRATVHKTQA